jgi:hypothetical protein
MRLAAFLCAVSFASVVHAQTVAPTVPQKPTKPMIDAAERYFRDGVRFTEEGNYDAHGRRDLQGQPAGLRSGT